MVPPKRDELSKDDGKIATVGNVLFEEDESEEEYACDFATYIAMEPKLKVTKNEVLQESKENFKQSDINERKDKPCRKDSTQIEEPDFYENKSNILSLMDDRKKEAFIKDYTDIEEQEFYQNEAVIIPLMDKLYGAISNDESDVAFTTLLEMRKILHTITPSFIDVKGIGKLLTSMRKKFYNDNNIQSEAKAMSVSMRKIYTEKMARRSKSFNQTWGNEHEQKCLLERSIKMIGADEAAYIPVKLLGNKLISPEPVKSQIESVIGDMQCINESEKETQTYAAHPSSIYVKISSGIKSKKAKFSLSAMIDTSKQLLVPSITFTGVVKENMASSRVSNVLPINNKATPKWLSETLGSNILDDTVGDEVRSLGKEFIEALDADWPDEVLEAINFKSFVHHIEQAIFEWSQKEQSFMVNNSYKKSDKILNYPENYWIKVRDIVSGLSGSEQFNKPKLLDLMLGGEFKTPMDLVKLPRVTFYKSMKNLLYISAAMFVYIVSFIVYFTLV